MIKMIKKLIAPVLMITLLSGLWGCKNNKSPETWTDKELDKWFTKAEFLNGWNVQPDNSINRKTFAINYFRNKERWDKAFMFLSKSNLSTLAPGRHNIDGDNLYASVTDYLTKDESEAGFEAHRKYADIQYVVRGKEIIQIAPIEKKDSIMQGYDESRDIEFFTTSEHKALEAVPEKFFIFFPSDAHKPGLKTEMPDSVRKVVIKVRLD